MTDETGAARVRELEQRIRRATQMVIAQIGATGPENLEDAIGRLKQRLAEVERERDNAVWLAANAAEERDTIRTIFDSVKSERDTLRRENQELKATVAAKQTAYHQAEKTAGHWLTKCQERERELAAVRAERVKDVSECVSRTRKLQDLERENQRLREWIIGRGTKAAVDITGDPDDVREHPPTLEQAQAAIDAHMRLGVERNAEANRLREALEKIAKPALGGKQQQYIAKQALAGRSGEE